MNRAAIGVIDSGVGGLTVLKALQTHLPSESILYFGDTARVPYGEKSSRAIQTFSKQCADFLITEGIKLLIVACNTATAHALEWLREQLRIPVIGVIEPAVYAACRISKSGRIGVIATRQTIASEIYPHMLRRTRPEVRVWTAACPLLVPIVEEALWNDPVTATIVQRYLTPIKAAECDTLVLGCTHYPLLREIIQETIGPDIHLIDSAQGCAESVTSLLDTHHLHAPPAQGSTYAFFVSDDPARFAALGSRFLGKPLEKVAHVINHG